MFYKGICYEEAGEGETIIFLHGWGGGIASFKGTSAYLSRFCRAVNLEFPGFGQSAAPSAPYTVYDYAESVRDLILSLDCGRVTLIGHSFGGRIALILAALYPDMVKSAVFIDAAGLRPRRGIKYLLRKLGYKLAKLLVKTGLARPGILEKQGSPDYRALSGVMRKTFVNVINEHLNKFTHKIICPALIIWGRDDRDTPLYMARYFNRHIPGSRLAVFKGAGHYSYIDKFHECNALLKEWILKE